MRATLPLFSLASFLGEEIRQWGSLLEEEGFVGTVFKCLAKQDKHGPTLLSRIQFDMTVIPLGFRLD